MVDEELELDERDASESHDELQKSVEKLNRSVAELIDIFRTASADIHAEADSDLGRKFDLLIRQNQEIMKAVVALLELEKEYLPKIARNAEGTAMVRRPLTPTMPSPLMPVVPVQKQAVAKPQPQTPPPLFQPVQPANNNAAGQGIGLAEEPKFEGPKLDILELPDFSSNEETKETKTEEKKGFLGFGK